MLDRCAAEVNAQQPAVAARIAEGLLSLLQGAGQDLGPPTWVCATRLVAAIALFIIFFSNYRRNR